MATWHPSQPAPRAAAADRPAAAGALREILIDALIDIQVAELQGGTLLATSTLEALRELGGGATRLATRRLRLSRDGDPAIRSARTSEPVAGMRTRRTTTPRKRS